MKGREGLELTALQNLNEAPAVQTLSWYITGLQVLYITSLVTNYKQITVSLHEQGTHKSQLVYVI